MRKLFVPTKEKTKAQAIVEFALVLPILLMMIYGMMEVGRLLFIYASTVSAARQAARYGAATGTSPNGVPYYQDCTGIESSARQLGFLNQFTAVNIGYDAGVDNTTGASVPLVLTSPEDDVCGSFTTAQNGDRITVEVETVWSPMTPLVPLRSFTIRSQSERTILVSVDIAVTGEPEPWSGTGGVPVLTITPSAASYDHVNEKITYTYTITNIGNGDLMGAFNVIDPNGVVAITCPTPPTTLAPKATYTCLGEYYITQTDLDAGHFTTTGVASPPNPTPDATTVVVTLGAIQRGEMTLTKTPSAKASITTVTYTYSLKNTGNVTLSADGLSVYKIVDDKLGTICEGGSRSDPDNAGSTVLPLQIAPGATITCTKTHAITNQEKLDGTLVNNALATAFYSRYDLATHSTSIAQVDAAAQATITTTPIALDVTGVLVKGSSPYTSQQIIYTFTVENVGETNVNLSSITLPAGTFTGQGTTPTVSCSGFIAANGGTLTCPIVTYNVVQADLDSINATTGAEEPIAITATATAVATSGAPTYYSTKYDYPVALYRKAELTLTAVTSVTVGGVTTSNPAVTTTPGSQVTYTYTITNTGNVTMSPPAGGFTVVDTQITNDSITCDAPTLPIAPGGTKVCTGTREILQEDVDNGSVIGTAETSAMFGVATYSYTAKSVTITSTIPRLKLEIETPLSSVIGAGVNIPYTYILTNTGNASLSTDATTPYDFVLTLLKSTPINTSPTCAQTTLEIGESTTCTGVYTTKSTDKGTDVVNTTSAYAYTAANVQVHSNTASVTVSVTTPTYCSISHGPLTVQTIGVLNTFGMTITNNNEYSVDVDSITITYNDDPNNQQITKLSLGIGNILWAKDNQSMSGVYTFTLGVFTGNYTLAPGASGVLLYISDWKTAYTPNGAEKITVSFTDASCPDLDSSVPSVVPTTEVQVVKNDGVDSVDTNALVDYTVTVTNHGPSTLINAKLSDPVASGLDKKTIVCSTGCSIAPTKTQLESGSFVLPNLAAGESYSIIVTAKVTAVAGSTVTNLAAVTLPMGVTDPGLYPNSDTDVDVVANPRADLQVEKDDGVTTVASGANTTYTIRVTNNGPSTITGAKLTDPAVTGLIKTTPITCSSTPGQCISSAVPTITQLQTGYLLPTLTSGQFYEILVPATMTAASGVSVTNTATIAAPTGAVDPTPGNNTATDMDEATGAVADLEISKSNGLTAVSSGGNIVYTIRVTNNGPSSVTGATLSDPAVTGLSKTSVACSSTPGACTGTISVSALEGGYLLPAIGANQFYEIAVTTHVTATGGNVINTAYIAAPASATDPVPGNDSASDSDPVSSVLADLKITKTDGVTSVNPSATVTYTMVVTNLGPVAANNAVFRDTATGVTFTNITCGSATGGAVCPSPTVGAMASGITIATLPSGGSVTFTATGTVTATSGSIENTATITTPSGVTDPTSSNDSATDTDTVNMRADLAITKTDGITSINAGSATLYTIVISNNGPSPADNAVFKDPIINGLNVTDVTCGPVTGGAVCPTSSVDAMQGAGIIIPSLPSGATITFKVTGTMVGNVTPVANVATVTVPVNVTDPVSSNNSATDPADTVNPAADLAISKNDGYADVGSGETISYQIVVTNNGPSAANNAIFKDPAITGFNVTGVTCTLPTSGAACPTIANTTKTLMQGTGIIIPTLPNGGTVTFTVTGTVTATSGSIENRATIDTPSGVVSLVSTNNAASDTDNVILIADLAISKTDNRTSIGTGKTTTYEVVISNNGPSPADGAIFKDPAVSGLTVTNVSCVAENSAVCPTMTPVATAISNMQGASGLVIPTLPDNGSVTFTITGTVTATSGTLTNSATVTVPTGTTDLISGNNTASDSTSVIGICTLANLSAGSLTYSGKTVTWPVTNSTGASLSIVGLEVKWDGAGSSASDYQLSSITLNNGSTLNTTLPTGVSPYVSGTGTLKTGATTFTFTFSKNNPTGVGVTLTLSNSSVTCNIVKP